HPVATDTDSRSSLHDSRLLLEVRLRYRQPRHIRTRAEHRTFQSAIVGVVSGYRVQIAHIGTTESYAGHRLGRYFNSPIDGAVWLEPNDLARTHHDRGPDAALCVDGHSVGIPFWNLRE